MHVFPQRLALVVASVPLAAPAFAGEWSGSTTVASQYVTRGFAQSWGRPALQGDVGYEAENGFHAGAWASSVSDLAVEDGTAEVDLYVGYAKAFGDVTLGVSAYQYLYPGARMSASDVSYDYGEIIPSVEWKGLTVSYAYTVTEDFNGYNSRSLGEEGDRHSRGSTYLDATLELPLGESTRVTLHAGRQTVRNFEAYNWSDARVGIARDFSDSWTASADYTKGWADDGIYDEYTTGVADRNGVVHTSNPLAAGWVFAITRSF